MENIYQKLRIEAAEAGVTLSEVCRRTGVNRQTVQGWGKREPKILKALNKLRAEMDKIKKEKTTATA